MYGAEFWVEGSNAERVVEKLAAGGVLVCSAVREQKNILRIRVRGKDGKKVFAILHGSCYNIRKVRRAGLAKIPQLLVRYAGLIAGAAFCLGAILFCEGRVLKVSIEGSGACYAQEIRRVLEESGVHAFSAAPAAPSSIAARILALPRVSFCTLSHAGGVLTVHVETEDEAQPLAGGALLAPVSGEVEALTVVRGQALVAVGDGVEAGDVLVQPCAEGYAMAYAAVRYLVDAEYPGSEEAARAQSFLDHGEIADLQIQKTERGWRVTGSARRRAAINLG